MGGHPPSPPALRLRSGQASGLRPSALPGGRTSGSCSHQLQQLPFRLGDAAADAAVLDWELAHVGDPMEDLGWVCVRSWRFGRDDLPVAGVGTREEFWRAYEDAGGCPVDAGRVRFWEAFGNLRWGVICIGQAKAYLDNPGGGSAGAQMELGSIGRRIAETEWELLELMEGSTHPAGQASA